MTDLTTPLSIIGAASGLGAPDDRCAAGPQALQAALQHAPEPALVWQQTVNAESHGGAAALDDFLTRLSDSCAAVLRDQPRIAVIGGDHACAMGTWRGVRRTLGPVGLVWVDAHLDAHTPQTSPSGYRHGMPLADLLGQLGSAAVIDARRLCLVGVRSYEGAERELLQRLGVRVITMDEVGRLGLGAAMDEAVSIAAAGDQVYGISIDLDALDLADAPAVGSPVVGGIRAADLLAWLATRASDPRLRALEVAEFNPAIDVQQRTLKLLVQILKTASGAAHEPDHRT